MQAHVDLVGAAHHVVVGEHVDLVAVPLHQDPRAQARLAELPLLALAVLRVAEEEVPGGLEARRPRWATTSSVLISTTTGSTASATPRKEYWICSRLSGTCTGCRTGRAVAGSRCPMLKAGEQAARNRALKLNAAAAARLFRVIRPPDGL